MTRVSLGEIITFLEESGQGDRYFVHRYLRSRPYVVVRSCVTSALSTVSVRSLALQIACGTAFVSGSEASAKEATISRGGARLAGRQTYDDAMLVHRQNARILFEKKYGTRRLTLARQSVRARAEGLLHRVDLFDDETAASKGGDQ